MRRAVRDGSVLLVASFGAFLAFLDATIVNAAFPDIRASFPDTGIGGLSWVFNAYNVVFAAFLVASGRLSDLLGRRRLYVGGIGLFTFASLLCGLAPSVETLIAARVLQALGAAILVPSSLALVLAAFPADRRAHAVGLWGAAAALAGGLGPPLGGALVELEGWRSTFLVNLPLGAAAIVIARRTLVESRAPGRRVMPDLAGSGLFGLGIALLTLGIVQGDGWGWTSPAVLGCFAAAVLLVAVVARRLGTHASPVVDPALLRIRPFALGNTLTIFAGAGFYAYILCHILFLTSVWRYSVLEAGLAVAPGALVAVLAAGTLGKIADRRDPRLVIVPGALVWASAFAWYIAVPGPEPHFLTHWLPGQILSGIGVGATLPVLGAAAAASVPGGRYATAAAVLSSARQLGGVLGVALLVVIIGTPSDLAGAQAAFDDGWTFTAACFLAVALGTPLLGRIERDGTAGDDAHPAPARLASLHLGTLAHGPGPLPEVRPAPAPAAMTTSPSQLLAEVPLLDGLEPVWIERLARDAEEISVLAGTQLFHAGDEPDALYVLVLGRLEVVKRDQVVAELHHGGAVGELGLLSGTPRAATIRATRDSRLLRIGRASFEAALAESPDVARRLLARLAGDVQASPTRAHQKRTTPAVIGLLPLGRGPATALVARHLSEELRRHGSLAVLEAGDAETLAAAEAAHDRVLLVAAADAAPSWRTFVLRHADRVVALCPPGGPAAPLQDGCRGCELVFCDRVPDTATLDRIQRDLGPRATTRLAPGDREALARLARRLSGRAVGLVLSGGGARALAHVGVLEELDAQGVEIDCIAGVSMGALIGALYAKGLSPEQIDAVCYEEFVRRSPIGDYTIPRHALFSGRRGKAMIERVYGDLRFEHLERDLSVVSADLYARELVVQRTGPLFPALASTTLIPGLLPPLNHDGRVLVDGGVLDNLPVHALAARGEGPVIAVDVTDRLSAPDGDGLPPLRDVLIRAVTLGSVDASAAERDAALLIRPDSNGTGMFEWHQIDEVREAGRRAARDALTTANVRQ